MFYAHLFAQLFRAQLPLLGLIIKIVKQFFVLARFFKSVWAKVLRSVLAGQMP